jgi:DNA-binding protein WhiA
VFLRALVQAEGARGGGAAVELFTRSAAVTRTILRLAREQGWRPRWEAHRVRALGPGHRFRVWLEEAPVSQVLALPRLRRRCCRRAWLAAWLAASGSVNPPEHSYHLEWTAARAEQAEFLQRLLAAEGLQARRAWRRGHQVVALRRGDQVSRALQALQATWGLLRFEEVRAVKETRNLTRRRVNAETANLARTTEASVRQVAALRDMEARGELDRLPAGQRELARLRLAHPELSLRELGQRLHPPLTRAAVGRKLARLLAARSQVSDQGQMSSTSGSPLPTV